MKNSIIHRSDRVQNKFVPLFFTRINQIFIYFILFLPLFVSSCSQDDSEPLPNVEETEITPYSIEVSAENTNVPSAGVLSTQYSDSPEGSNISYLIDSKSSTVFMTQHDKFYIIWNGNKNTVRNNFV